ncbi:MAG TPA: phage GP46 family protein [Rhizomicrobium sp.]|nr:phage GP46 family protein [Rhizomicrobium sp.]
MSSDIATVWDAKNSRGDWQKSGADLKSGNDLETAVLISLFSDRLAKPDDAIPDNTDNPRGWWGDLDASKPMGSRLWLLERSKLSQKVAIAAQGYITEALQWLIDDGIASKVDVTTQLVPPSQLSVRVVITRATGAALSLNYAWAWQGLN